MINWQNRQATRVRLGSGRLTGFRWGRPNGRVYFRSMPWVGALPVKVAQQKAESLPHLSQTCLTSVFAPLPVPTTVRLLLQPGHKCFSPGVITWICPFALVTVSTVTDLHLAQTMATESPGLSSY